MFETPFIRVKFRGKIITFDVTRSGAVLGNIPPLNQLPAIMRYFHAEGCKRVLDFGAGKSQRNTKPYVKDPRFEMYISEFEQLISHNLSVDQIKDPTKFVNALREPRTPLSQYLRDRLSKETLESLSKYTGPKPPLKTLQQAIVDELNTLLQDNSLYEKERFATVTLTRKVQSLIEQDPKHRKKLLRLNRFLLQEAYPGEIAECSNNLEKLLYPEELEIEPLDFDAILLSYVLHILPGREHRMKVLRACWEKAKTGAKLVVASPNYNTPARRAVSTYDKYEDGWVKYNTSKETYKAFYSEPDQDYLIELVTDAGFQYEGNWHQSTAKVLRFNKS
jgi:hypothetical protein